MTLASVLEFLAQQHEKGLCNDYPRLAGAVRTLQSVLGGGEDSVDFVEAHLDELLGRLTHRQPPVSSSTRKVYKSYLRKALAQAQGRDWEKRARRPLPLAGALAVATGADGTRASNAAPHEGAKPGTGPRPQPEPALESSGAPPPTGFGRVIGFVQAQRAAGVYSEWTSGDLLAACRAVASVLQDGEDSPEFVAAHLEELLERYCQRRALTAGVRLQYANRVRRALADYRESAAAGAPRFFPPDMYASGDWNWTRQSWWEPMVLQPEQPPALPSWWASREPPSGRESTVMQQSAAPDSTPRVELVSVEQARAMTTQERLAAMARACEVGAERHAPLANAEGVLDVDEQLPESSRVALARLRKEFQEKEGRQEARNKSEPEDEEQ